MFSLIQGLPSGFLWKYGTSNYPMVHRYRPQLILRGDFGIYQCFGEISLFVVSTLAFACQSHHTHSCWSSKFVWSNPRFFDNYINSSFPIRLII
jgi:hypothetical protein